MVKQTWKIILFLDNASCHPHITLSNEQLAWFPPNTSSCTQPMDQGVIYTYKCHYRRSLLQSLIPKISSCNTINELAGSIFVLDAIHWTAAAVKQIQPETVAKCFQKAGFNAPTTLHDIQDEASESLASIAHLLDHNNINAAAEDYVQIDEAIFTDANINSAANLIIQNEEESDAEDEEDDENGDDERDEKRITDARRALSMTNDLVRFAATSNCSKILSLLYEVKNNLESSIAAEKTRQMTLDEMGHHEMS